MTNYMLLKALLPLAAAFVFSLVATAPVKIEQSAIFFSKEGTSSHTLHYSTILLDYDLVALKTNLVRVRTAVRNTAAKMGARLPLNNYKEHVTGHHLEDPTLPDNEKVAHRIEYALSGSLMRLAKLSALFRPIKDVVENHAIDHPKEARDFFFGTAPAADPMTQVSIPGRRHRRGLPTGDDYRRSPTTLTTHWTEQLYAGGLHIDPRTKRFVVTLVTIAIIAASVATTVGGVYLAAEIHRIKQKQERLDYLSSLHIKATKAIGNSEEELNRLTQEVVGVLDRYWTSMDTIGHVQLVVDVVDRRLTVIEAAYEAAMQQKVAVTSFTELHFARTAMKVERDARQAGLQPVTKYFSDYLQFAASFIKTNKGFAVMVHVPLIDPDSVLTIYAHHALPIPLNDDLYLHLGPMAFSHIAVSQDGKLFRSMTLAEYNSCRTIGEFHLCDKGLVVRKIPLPDSEPPPYKDPQLCLYALYARRFELAIAVCETIIGVKDTAMQQIGPNAFASYAATPHQGKVVCRGDNNPSGPATTTFTVHGLQRIQLPFGCTAETDTHVFAAADDSFSRDLEEYSIAYDWPFDVHHLTKGLNTSALRLLFDRLGDLDNRTLHTLPLIDALEQVRDSTSVPPDFRQMVDNTNHYTSTIMGVTIIGLLLATLFFAFFARRYKRQLEGDLQRGRHRVQENMKDIEHLRKLFTSFEQSSPPQPRSAHRKQVAPKPQPLRLRQELPLQLQHDPAALDDQQQRQIQVHFHNDGGVRYQPRPANVFVPPPARDMLEILDENGRN